MLPKEARDFLAVMSSKAPVSNGNWLSTSKAILVAEGSRPRLSRLAVNKDKSTLVEPSLTPRLNLPVKLPTFTFFRTTATLSLIMAAGAEASRDRVVLRPSCTATTPPAAKRSARTLLPVAL